MAPRGAQGAPEDLLRASQAVVDDQRGSQAPVDLLQVSEARVDDQLEPRAPVDLLRVLEARVVGPARGQPQPEADPPPEPRIRDFEMTAHPRAVFLFTLEIFPWTAFPWRPSNTSE